jgi:hypothetical protein
MQAKILILLFLCHTLADYTHLSTPFMLNAKRFGRPLFPILAHASIHAGLMLTVLLFFTDTLTASCLFAVQLVFHFLIDTLKGRMNGWFPSLQSPANTWHWVVFGADQYLHALVIIFMAYNI